MDNLHLVLTLRTCRHYMLVMISLGNYLVYQSDNCLLSNYQFIVVDILPKISPETIQKAMITKKY